MKDNSQTAANGHADDLAQENPELENFGEETKTNDNDIVAKAATIAVVGVGVALISTELIPGMLIGLAAAFLPGIGPKMKPLLKSTVRAGYAAVQKTREIVAEASEQMQDAVAEARAEHSAKAEQPSGPASNSTGARAN
jgi:hypothetical protein